MDTLSRTQMVDELVQAYVDWREACARVNDAYRTWTSESGRWGRVAFGAYTAALDSEEQAARVYSRLVERAHTLRWDEEPPAEPLGGAARGVAWP